MPLPRRRSLAGLVAIGATALIAGCGGGGDDQLSAEEFRTQADAICTDANTQLDAVGEPSSSAEVLTFLQTSLPIQQAQLDRLRELDPPDDLQADFDTGVGAIQEQIDVVQDAATRIEGGEDPNAVITELGPQIESINEQSDAAAQRLGLTVCGSDSDEEPTATAPTTTAAPATTDAPTTAASGDAAAYVADVQEAATALQEFGTILQGSTGLDDLRTKIPQAQAALDTFDTAIADLDGYTLEVTRLEEQRSGLAETGPAVSDVLRRFLDAADQGDLAAVQALIPEVTQTIGQFQAAATGS